MLNSQIQKGKVSGIILSGGSSSRFQLSKKPWLDKALAKTNQEEVMLLKIVDTFSSFCDEIIIVAKNSDYEYRYEKIISEKYPKKKNTIKIVKDNPNFLCSGPSLGIITGLISASNNYAVVSPVDMPYTTSEIFIEMLNKLIEATLVTPLWSSTGKIEPLIFAVEIKSTLLPCAILSQIRRSRADDLHRAVDSIGFLKIKKSKEAEFEKILTSINDRSSLEKIDYKTITPNGQFFDSFTVHKKDFIESTLETINKFLKLDTSVNSQETNFIQLLELTKKLKQQNLDFYSGLILYNFLDIYSLKLEINFPNQKKIISKECIDSFLREASYWNQKTLTFLELHAYIDAKKTTKLIHDSNRRKELDQTINSLMIKMSLKKKDHKKITFESIIEGKYPSIINETKSLIQKSEKEFNEQSPILETDFLWDHSLRVSKIAFKIAINEGVDPIIPSLGALLHDAGKFKFGRYHSDSVAEEVHSAGIARELLADAGMTSNEISLVVKAINALYNDSIICDKNCQIIHDADRLEKLGSLGIANFFTKSTLRGTNLTNSILTSLSRELTYAHAAPKTMFTKTGQDFAIIRSKKTIDFFEDLLEEFGTFKIARFYQKHISDEKLGDFVLVVPEECPSCKGKFLIDLSIEKGIKCKKLTALYSCNSCKKNYKIAFCLPLLSSKK